MTIFDLNIFGIHIAPSYYGLMYAIGFISGYLIIKKSRLQDYFKNDKENKRIDSLLFYIFLGVIIGGRFGYILFYDIGYYIENISEILKIWKGGMSFHGGVIGVIIAMITYSRRKKISFFEIADEVTRILPIGIGAGRFGNYLNKELLGKEYSGFLSVEKDGISYFPSPLVELILEGIILYIILNYFYKKKHKKGQIASLFLIFYAIFRIIVEIFFRTPDPQIGYLFGFMTMGIILSLPMLIIGIFFYYYLGKTK
ncbi:prolipoprotein diacylglyceryl transferase [Candidatus Gracilibacteria bacterium]|nr:MAG: prolipoprotein diacylglyceryl transferase [Candidatus Gracilibacteria bacterium]PIE85189.1 MAG: prolipoprotein diacylglyceryl transferase [Candidatus Gracilibacteria bacterium]